MTIYEFPSGVVRHEYPAKQPPAVRQAGQKASDEYLRPIPLSLLEDFKSDPASFIEGFEERKSSNQEPYHNLITGQHTRTGAEGETDTSSMSIFILEPGWAARAIGKALRRPPKNAYLDIERF